MTATALDRVGEVVADEANLLVELSHRIHAHPEVAWTELRASTWVAEHLAQRGFTVARGVADLPTAVRGVAGPGPLTAVVCAEYDALPGLGHACGHNVIAASSVGAATALAAVADDLGIRVVLLGTPAEEGGGGKVLMLDRGAFHGAHLALMAHPGPVDVARAQPYAVRHLGIEYTGQTSHAAAYPERGRNAADAFTVAQVGIGLLRQQLGEGVRIHGVVTHNGDVPNAIPAFTKGRWYVRGDTTARMHDAVQRVRACFEAGALATGCDVSIADESPPYAEFRTDEWLLRRYVVHAEALGRELTSAEAPDARMNRASTDMGNVSQRMPAIHPYLGIESLPAVNHQPAFADAAVRPAADRAVLDAAIALARTACDAATDPVHRTRLLSGQQEVPDA